MINQNLLEEDVKRKRDLPGVNFVIGLFLGMLLFMFVVQIIIFSAYYQPQEFGNTYKEIFCTSIK